MTPKTARRPTRRTDRSAERDAERDTEQEIGESGGVIAGADAAQADDELAELANQMADGAMLTLYRLLEGGEKEWVDEQPVAGFSVGDVARKFGGGRYVIYLRKPDPDVAGKSIRQGSKRFTIGGAPKYPSPDPIAAVSPVAGAVEAAKLSATYGDLMQSTIRQSLEQMDMLQKMQLAVIASLTQRPPDTTAELLKTLLPALIGRQQGGITFADAIALGDRLSSRNAPTAGLKETLELLAAAREMAGGEAPVPPWLGVASKAIEVIGRAVEYKGPRQLPPGTEVVVADDGAPPAAPPAAEVSPVSPSAHPLLHFLAPQIPGLMTHAEKDHDADNYAGPLVDTIPPEHYAEVLRYLQSPDFMVQLQTAFPMTQRLLDWFGELRDCVVERIQDEMTPPDPHAPAAS